MDALRVITLLVGAIVTGEATALAIGMHLVKKSKSPWISLKNDLLMALDVVVGLALIFIAFDGGALIQPIWFSIFVLIGLLTHIYRIWENLAGREIPFCGNRSLFILNNIKFIGLLVILVWGG